MRRLFSALCAISLLVAMLTIPALPASAQTLRERLQKAREDRDTQAKNAKDSGDSPAARRGIFGPRTGNGAPPSARGDSATIRRGAAPRNPASPRGTPVGESAAQWVRYLGRLQPKSAAAYNELPLDGFAQGVSGVEYWTAQLARFEGVERADQMLVVVEQLLAAKADIDRQLETAFDQRTAFAAIEPEEQRREAITKYLWATSSYIDLSGRIRYTLYDALNDAADEIAARPADYNRFVDLVTQFKSSVGAVVVSAGLFDPPRNEEGMVAVSSAAKLKILRLIGESGNYELVPDVAALIKQPATPPRLVLAAADALFRLGVPQDERPGQDATLPKPPITAGELEALLSRLDVRRLAPDERRLRDDLVRSAAVLAKNGLVDNQYRLGSMVIQPGDWLLMRNPSPYNLFTDLSPGLFTHVGVATIERGSDGKRRMVIVDIPERGPEMPATNVDAFVARTRHFVFLRHPDADTARRMAEAAAATIGNVTEFDLNFRTDRVLPLKGQPLAGKKIHTYCAGLLFVCTLETGRPREEFFPLREGPAAGYTAENLAKFGFTFGDDFISPTGAFFSPNMRLVGRRQPMYDPQREIEEAVFDHFAQSLMTEQVTPAADAFQLLRLKVAEAAKENPLLAKAVASAAGVAEDMDLVAAAKAKALIENLDEVAYGASGEFVAARDAIMSAGATPPNVRLSAADQAKRKELLARHADLVDRWQKNQLSPRALRVELVRFYIAAGKRGLEERFFAKGT